MDEISAIKCKHCGDIIFSRTRHDFRSCMCEKVFIDGGRDYLKISGNIEDMENIILETTLDGNVKEMLGANANVWSILAFDYNVGQDQLGRIGKDIDINSETFTPIACGIRVRIKSKNIPTLPRHSYKLAYLIHKGE